MPLVLATDLDGTFLGGSEPQRAALYQWLAPLRTHITLIFVTGRGLNFVRQLARELPESARPDHVIANVGTTAATGPELRPLESVEAWLDANWSTDAPTKIASVLAAHHHLTPQPVVEGRRMSYFFKDRHRAEHAKNDVETAGFDALLSDNVYFDVLPKGVRKGPTLLRTLDALGVDHDDVFVAGDTFNDFSLFETGLRGVAVANSEPALRSAVQNMPHVVQSSEPGAAGILREFSQFFAARRAT